MQRVRHTVVAGAIILAAVAAAGACDARGAPPDDPAAHGRWALAEVHRLRPPRTFPARLSLAQPYRPCGTEVAPPDVAATSASCDAASPDLAPPPRLAAVVAAAAARARLRVDPEALHALALADLVWSDTAGNALDRSVSTLRTVARLAERPAPALADLAAALLARAERRGEARDLFEAAEVASLAVEADSTYPVAHFNLALALGQLGLVDETARGWNAYLAVEPRGPWADEARRRAAPLAALAPPRFDPGAADLAGAVARAPQEARLHGWNVALGAWGAATRAGDAEGAARQLALARGVGRALEARGGDATLADAVRVIDAAAGDAPRTRALAAAHQAFAAGYASYAATRYREAERGFAQAVAAPAPLGLWAQAFAGATHTYAGRRARAESLFRGVLARADSLRHPALVGRTRWMLGLTLTRMGRTEEALAVARQAAVDFTRADEQEYLGAVQAIATQAAFVLGDSRATLATARDALATLRRHRASLWLHSALFVAAGGAERDGLVRVALRVQNEGVTVATRMGRPAYAAEARLVRARLAARVGPAARVRAESDVVAARHALGTMLPGATRDWITADLRVAEAVLLSAHDPGRATAALDPVIAYFERPVVPMRLVPALVARADARLSGNDAAGAGRDLDRALALIAAEQGRTDSVPLRASLVDAARSSVDRAVMFHARRGSAAASLARRESGRVGLVRRDRVADGTAVRAPAGHTALVYALVGDTLLTWTVRDTVAHLTRAPISRAVLARTIERARTALDQRTGDAARPDLARLYDQLVRPVRSQIVPGAPLVIVADGELDAVPWAALLDRGRDRYLVEDHVLRTAVSLADAKGAPPAHASRSDSVLLVANPAVDPAAYPTLRPLAGASAEVEDVVRRYPGARVLAGRDATAPALLAALPRTTLVHYAGHAVFDDERPERSLLALATARTGAGEGTAGAGAFTAERIASLDLRRVRLVVLSACETVRSPAGRAGGFAGLAGAFTTAGVRGVIGTLWRVDDQATRALMRAFYNAYGNAYGRAGDAAGALRVAQLELLRSDDPMLRSPASWAGFRYLGR